MRRITVAMGLAALGGSLLLAAPVQAGGFCGEVPASEETGITVKMGEDCFLPTVLRAPSGATVTWINDDPRPHTVTGVGMWSDRHGEIAPRDRVSIRFDRDGIYVYTCLVHPGMAGAIVVGDPAGPGAAGATDAEPPAQEVPALPETPAVEEVPEPGPSTGATLPVVGGVVGLAGAGIGFELGRRRRR